MVHGVGVETANSLLEAVDASNAISVALALVSIRGSLEKTQRGVGNAFEARLASIRNSTCGSSLST